MDDTIWRAHYADWFGYCLFWFGALKLVPGLSPAEELVRNTVYLLAHSAHLGNAHWLGVDFWQVYALDFIAAFFADAGNGFAAVNLAGSHLDKFSLWADLGGSVYHQEFGSYWSRVGIGRYSAGRSARTGAFDQALTMLNGPEEQYLQYPDLCTGPPGSHVRISFKSVMSRHWLIKVWIS